MTDELNRMRSRGTSGSTEGENKIRTYDLYLSDLFLKGIIEGCVSFGRPTLELAAFIRSLGLFTTALNEWVSMSIVIVIKWLSI